jgi:ATP-dependent DNA helicase RecQ
MRKFSANYTQSNHNFVIQNLEGQRIDNKYLASICIVKNILQRGKPSLTSSFLQEHLGEIHLREDFNNPIPLIDKSPAIWERIIRGDVKGNYFPAKKFYEELIPKYLGKYAFIQQLLIPEVPINEITQVQVDEFNDQQVDFYLPQAYLIIEIDGSHHKESKEKDDQRDQHTKKYGIETIRITTQDLELENQVFKTAIQSIIKRIDKVKSQQKTRRESGGQFIAFTDYESYLNDELDIDPTLLRSIAIIRFQLTLLELLEYGKLDFSHKWQIELLTNDIKAFAHLAIEDLFIWFENILGLHKTPFNRPEVEIKELLSREEFGTDNNILKIDFSIQKRYTDEFQVNPSILYVRNDYFDEFLYFKQGDSREKLKFSDFKAYDYFQVSTTNPVNYRLTFGGDSKDKENLRYLLWNLFLQNQQGIDFESVSFREGQLPILSNILSRNDTIGLLPTGSGKSVCYQLAAILQPSISFVVCPIKSLMYDQKADLDRAFFHRTNHITGDDDSEQKELIQRQFGNGKYFFIFISPERFQLKTFRQYFSAVNEKYNIAYAVIDEVHCLSEWGHDFRTSYLNLSNTIKRLCSDFNFLGLTATASINVLKDIQIEFGIKQENVKTPRDYTRDELEFIISNDHGNKEEAIKELLHGLKQDIGALSVNGEATKSGIIFTPHVNGRNGCHPLSLSLTEEFHEDVRYYSGSVPKVQRRPIMGDDEFDIYKKQVQQEFKNNQFSLLTATKAFGMGVNKGNIHYTIHYGIPGSMESLYQEAGRAGRKKELFQNTKAQCHVLLSKTPDPSKLEPIWERATTLSQINEHINEITGDVNTNLFLFTLGMDVIKDEFETIKALHKTFSVPGKTAIPVDGKSINKTKARTEKAIYRLNQLGIIRDWTISNFFGGGEFEVDFEEYTEDSISNALLNTIRKYDKQFSLESLVGDDRYKTYAKIIDKAETSFDQNILLLLQWSYDNFAYNRRQSLKNIYENSCLYADGEIDSAEFKTRLENYFRFSEGSFLLQHIAENEFDFQKWFEVFYQIDKNIVTDSLIDQRQVETLRDSLSRVLESYMYNTGLDYISGLTRLWLDDYDNADGKERFKGALTRIKERFDNSQRQTILQETLKIGRNLRSHQRELLSQSLTSIYNANKELLLINSYLQDEHTTLALVEDYNKRLELVNQKIYAGLK